MDNEASIFEAFADLLPKGAIPVTGVRALVFIDANGDNGYVIEWRGDAPLSTAIGLLELAKLDTIEATRVHDE